MVKPWFSYKSVLRLALGLALVPLLTSCLELAVKVDFRTSSAGQIQVDALAYRMAQGIHFVEGSDRISFPSTRAEWQAIVDQAPGSTLISWSGTDEDLGFRSKTLLGFSTSRGLETLFIVFKQKLTLLQNTQGTWNLVFAPQVPRITAADAETRKLWTALWGQVVWSFSFTPPNQSASVRSIPLTELAGVQPPAEWNLSW